MLALSLAFLAAASPQEPADADRHGVVWDSPGRDSSASMPLGNGDLAANVWAEEGGDLRILLGRCDAWSGNGRLLKLGGLRLALEPNPFAAGAPFRQSLVLSRGEVVVRAGAPGREVALTIAVDEGAPVLRVVVDAAQPVSLRASLDLWRRAERTLTGRESFSAMGMQDGPHPIVEEADTVLPPKGSRLRWLHRNTRSIYPLTMELQGLGELLPKFPDPLLHRSFGACVFGPGLEASGAEALASQDPARRWQLVAVAVTTQGSAEEWDRAALAAADAAGLDAEAAARARADRWGSFWRRSWIEVSGPGSEPAGIRPTSRPLRIGADSEGQNRFVGKIRRVRIWDRAPLDLDAPAPLLAGPARLVGDWTFATVRDGAVPNLAQGPGLDRLAARIVGDAGFEGEGESRAVVLGGRAFLEVPHDPSLDLSSFSIEVECAPGAQPPGGGRLVDKTIAGTADGFLLDTHPGNSLRSITAAGTLLHDAKLVPEKWVRVGAAFDGASFESSLSVDGRLVASRVWPRPCSISQGYALQRYVNACAGRGEFPIKFNGSLFTVDAREPGEHFDPDYRRWGGCYWFQNTRLPYASMLASGDLDLMEALFRMYRRALPLAEARTRAYYGHGGAFFPETMFFWGTYQNEIYGWDRRGKALGQADNTYIRYYWSGALELLTLALDRQDFAPDSAFLRETLLPLADAITAFYDQHYRRDAAGRIRFEPAASLETWHVAANPLPEIAGLRFVLPRLLALPGDAAGESQRSRWRRMLGELPELPSRAEAGRRFLLPAHEFSAEANVENPELYAIWPYALYGLGRPGLEVAEETFARRKHKGTGGWVQDAIQAACLGRAAEAASMVAKNFAARHAGSRFPAFFGPNYDWVPDQDHGAVAMTALQKMLLQWDGDRILVLPAWPKEWSARFRLHGPRGTTVEGTVAEGKLERLVVEPAARERDVVRFEPR